METEKSILIRELKSSEKHLETHWKNIASIERIPKHSGRSEEARREGNALFLKKDDDAETRMEIFSHYSRSISLAPLNSEEIALAYGNRSAFLLRLNKYEDCIKDINRALEITSSKLLKAKLYCRKVECMKNLGLCEFKSVLEQAESCSNEVDEKNKKSILELIDKVKAYPIECKARVNHRQHKNVHILPKIDNILDQVTIKRNEKYGRHLIAKKDYEPGDIIFIEDLFIAVLNPKMNYTNCNYCLKVCWSGIPCNFCSWAMFCSEDCQKKAWDSFHSVECSVIPYLKGVPVLFDSVKGAIRMLLIGINEAGSIQKLKEDLKLVDECTDETWKGFYKHGKFVSNSICSVYSLKSDDPEILKYTASVAGMVLVTIIQHGHLLSGYNLRNIKDLIENEDALFLGSLLMKCIAIRSFNSHSFSQRNCYCTRLKELKNNVNSCCERGSSLAPVASLINHGCFPNTSNCFTEDRKIVTYAVQHIKKYTQIFTTYVSHYFNVTLEQRQKRLQKYNFLCDCLACLKSWPPLLALSHFELAEKNYRIKSTGLEKKLYNNCTNIFGALDSKSFYFKNKDIKALREAMVQAKQIKQPSLLTCLMTEALDNVYSLIYGLKSPIQLFGQSKNV